MSSPGDAAARHLAAIVESSDDAIVSKDLDGRILSWNRAATRMFGFTAEEAIGQSILILIPDDRHAEERHVLSRIRRGESVEHFDTERRRKDGTLIPISLTVSPIRDADGTVVGASKIARDISERKRSETALSAAEAAQSDLHQRLLTLVAASRSLVGAPDIEAVLSATIDLAERLVKADGYAVWRLADGVWRPMVASGVSAEFIDVVGHRSDVDAAGPLDFTDPRAVTDIASDPRITRRRDAFAREGIRSLLAIPLFILDQWAGSLVFYYRTSQEFAEVDIETGRALGNLAAASITAAELYGRQRRQQMKAQLLAEVGTRLAGSLDYHETLTAVAELVVPRLADWCAVDLVGEDGMERLATVDGDARTQDRAQDLRWPAGEAPHSVSGVAAAARSLLIPRLTDALASAADGVDQSPGSAAPAATVYSYMSVPLVTRAKVIGTIAFATGESKREFTEDDLRFAEELALRAAMAVENARAYEEAQRANRVKDDFLATLSHELRTPLNAILGYSRMLRMSAVPEPRKEHALGVIERNASALAQIVGDVLDVSRIVAGKFRLTVQPVDIGRVIADAADTVAPSARERGVAIVLPGLARPVHVQGDPARLQQVIWNLLSNAIKFTPAGGEVRVELDETSGGVTLRVKDTGVGIPAAVLPHIFEPFLQADSRPSREFGGLGLGLAIVRRIVEMHDGVVEVESPGTGGGTEFRVTLPATR